MTESETTQQSLAERIAARGREALVMRLRAAYAEAAGTHADIVSIDDERIESMVQRAADRADGLQWRRALAGVAADELGISLTEALSNPAVAEAQRIVGAPSYEDSLAELMARPVPAQASPEAETGPVAQPEPKPEPDSEESVPESAPEPEPSPEPEPEPEPDEVAAEEEQPDQTGEQTADEPEHDDEASWHDEHAGEPQPTMEHSLTELDHPFAGDSRYEELELLDGHNLPPHRPEEDQLRVSAIHLGGVANLPIDEDGLDLRLSSDGLDIMQENDEIVGRLVWSEIDDLEVLSPRGLLRRNARKSSRMTIRTQHGDATFEIPAFSAEELRERIEPLVEHYGRLFKF